MKKQTILFLVLLLGGALIAVLLPGLLLRAQQNQLLENMQYIPSTHYNFRSDDQGLTLVNRLNAASSPDNSKVSLDFETVSNIYGQREEMLEQLNEELQRYCLTLMPDLPDEWVPQLTEDAFLRYEYSLDSTTMQGFMFCVADCSLAQGNIHLVADMENGRIVHLGLYNTSQLPKIYDYFTLRIAENMADYLTLSVVQSDFTVDTLNMLLGGGGQAGSIILKDDASEIKFSFSCWQDGLVFYPGS